MKRISFVNRLTPVMLTACVVLGVLVAIEWVSLSRQDGIASSSDVPPTDTADIQLTRSTYTAPDFSTYSEILERPLFLEGRTPPTPLTADQQAALSPGTKTQLAMRLEGIALTPEARIAVVRDLSNNKLLRLAEGARHQGWAVESINATNVTLKRGEQIQELTLDLDTKSVKKTPILRKQKRKK